MLQTTLRRAAATLTQASQSRTLRHCICARTAPQLIHNPHCTDAVAGLSTKATPAASSSSAPSPPSASSSSSLYRSPLRSVDDQEFKDLSHGAYALQAAGAHKYTLIWLHDVGQSVDTLKTLANIIQPQHTKVLVPQAPKLSISALPNEPDQHAWMDVLEEQYKVDAAEEGQEDEQGLKEITSHVHSLLRRELSSTPSVPSHSIILAGFGQGGALALHAGLTFDRPLAGILSLAGFLPVRESYPENIHPSQRGTPILAIHGNSDFIVPLAFAKLGYDRLKQAKQPILVKTEWAMGHFMSNASLMGSQSWMTHAFQKAQEGRDAPQK